MLKVFTFVIYFMLLSFGLSAQNPRVQASIEVKPEKIQPGTPIELSLKLENVSDTIIQPGEAYLRFALIKPIAKDSLNILFETEKVKMPQLEPKQSITLNFKASHKLPTVIDFIREDWLLHEYQAVLIINGKESIVSTMPLTCSVHYYPVFKQKTPPVEIKSS